MIFITFHGYFCTNMIVVEYIDITFTRICI